MSEGRGAAMATEYGIFSDEGLLESNFYSEEAAEAARRERYAEDDAEVHEICPDHPEHARATCELCNADEDE